MRKVKQEAKLEERIVVLASPSQRKTLKEIRDRLGLDSESAAVRFLIAAEARRCGLTVAETKVRGS